MFSLGYAQGAKWNATKWEHDGCKKLLIAAARGRDLYPVEAAANSKRARFEHRKRRRIEKSASIRGTRNGRCPRLGPRRGWRGTTPSPPDNGRGQRSRREPDVGSVATSQGSWVAPENSIRALLGPLGAVECPTTGDARRRGSEVGAV